MVALKGTELAARALGLVLQPMSARRPDEVDGAFAAMSRARADGLIVLADPVLLSARVRIADLATKGHLPTISELREHTEAGGLMPVIVQFPGRIAGGHGRAPTPGGA